MKPVMAILLAARHPADIKIEAQDYAPAFMRLRY